jgi:hypothetical protein
MNTQKKKPGTFHLQTSNNRWKWMAGATAATAAGVTASQASTITINLVGNYISATGGNHLNADLTGDGHPDLTIANAFYAVVPAGNSPPYTSRNRYYAGVSLNGVRAYAYFRADIYNTHFQLGSQRYYYEGAVGSLTGSIPIFFKDLSINGGAPTKGSLEVTVGKPGVQLDSFTYTSNTLTSNTLDHTSSVPDHGSSLALLAMGAGGVLALRRWRAGGP